MPVPTVYQSDLLMTNKFWVKLTKSGYRLIQDITLCLILDHFAAPRSIRGVLTSISNISKFLNNPLKFSLNSYLLN